MSRKVFIVDDDPLHLNMLRDHLDKNMNVVVTVFSKGEDCLSNLGQNPDLVILDYNLNSVDKTAKNGIDILKEIKKRNPKVSVIMLSGQDKIEVAVETIKNGAYDYVVKNEAAFKHTENVALNVFKSLKLAEVAKAYKTAFWVLSIAILSFLVLSIVLDAMGLINLYAVNL